MFVDERTFATRDEFKAWLEEHHATADGVWIKFAKKGSGVQSVTVAETLDLALCYGWIDGQRKPFDEIYFLQKFTPRRARSKWSKRNIGLVEKLIEAGEMRPAGFAEIERAKADGRWDAAYDSPAQHAGAAGPAGRARRATRTRPRSSRR